MKTIKPHALFTVWTTDETAECLDGVSDALCQRLWSLVPEKCEFAETPDVRFDRALAKVWRRLSAEDQTELNRLAEAHEAYLAALDEPEPVAPNRIDAAIAESIREGRAVEVTGSPDRHADLRRRCESSVTLGGDDRNDDITGYWGTNAAGAEWCIHVRG